MLVWIVPPLWMLRMEGERPDRATGLDTLRGLTLAALLLDLRDIPWRRGRGYDVDSLSNLFTSNDAWARLVVKEVARRVDDPTRMRALGFCVSVEHARFMARVFREAGVAAAAIWSDTPAAERGQALRDLAERRVNVVFSVDLFNEELAWKTLRRYLAQEGISEVSTFSQRDLYREAAARGLLEDPVVWFGYQKARNETSHTYNADKAREVHARAIVFCDDASKLLAEIEGRLDD